MELEIENANGILELAPKGSFTIRSISEFKKKIDNFLKNSKKIIINLEKVTEIDSSGIQALVALKKHSEKENSSLELINHSAGVLAILDLYGLMGYFGDPLKIPKKDSSLYSFAYGRKKGFY